MHRHSVWPVFLLALFSTTLVQARLRLGDTPQNSERDDVFRMEGVKRFGVGLSSLYLKARDDEQFDNGTGPALLVKMKLSNRIEADLMVSKYDQKMHETPILFAGETDVTPFLLSFKYILDTESRLLPYVSGGLGYFIVDHTMDPELQNLFRSFGFDYNEELENTVGGTAGVGFNFFWDRNMRSALFADYKYVYAQSDIIYTLSVPSAQLYARGQNVQLGGHMFNIGFFFYF